MAERAGGRLEGRLAHGCRSAVKGARFAAPLALSPPTLPRKARYGRAKRNAPRALTRRFRQTRSATPIPREFRAHRVCASTMLDRALYVDVKTYGRRIMTRSTDEHGGPPQSRKTLSIQVLELEEQSDSSR